MMPAYQRLFHARHAATVHCVVAFMLVIGALAWASHVDVPPAAGAQVQADASHAHIDVGGLVSGCDHCCHAGAHLVALLPQTIPNTFALAFSFVRTPDDNVIAPRADPPYIPPIA